MRQAVVSTMRSFLTTLPFAKVTMHSFKVYSILIYIIGVVCIHVQAVDECLFDLTCSTNYISKKYCCERKYPQDNVCGSSCIGESCIFNNDCAPGETCSSNKCISNIDECSSDSTCRNKYYFKKYCCERRYPEKHICKTDCLGESCFWNSDCAPGECCNSDNKCKSSGCTIDVSGLATWIVAVIVISILLVVVLPIAIVVFCCCCAAGEAASASNRPAQGGVVFTQQRGTVVHTQQLQPGQVSFQNPPPYQVGPPVYPLLTPVAGDVKH